LVRYADDLVVMCATQREAEDAVHYVADMLAELGLAVNWDKAAVVPLGPQLQFLGAEFYA
jgi:hypothetical protein